jgi:hypothetical protein
MGSLPDPDATVAAVGQSGKPRSLPNLGESFGNYRILRLLGRGGMGVVYEAEERDTGRRIALKVLGRQFDSPSDRTRFLREGRLAASINHPNSVYVFGTEEIDDTPTISMELVAGGTLQERVKNGGPMPVAAAVDAILQIVAGLEAAQAIGILHRDVKPGNCFEDAEGTVKIGDFGLSISTAARAEPSITTSGTMVGTPAFCSPEQLRGDELNARSDMYSVGGTLFYLLTGRVPFEGHNLAQLTANVLEKPAPSPREFRKEIPKGLAGVILRCLAKQPGDRYRSYEELRQALAPYTSTAPTPATLSLRLFAGVLDLVVLSAFGMAVIYVCFGDWIRYMDMMTERSPKALGWIFGLFFLSCLYYTVFEGFWGAAAGKALCRLRVVGPDKNPPGFFRALLRTFVYVILPVVPYWIMVGGDPKAMMGNGSITQLLLGLSYYLILALLFSTVRRRNGFAAVQDLVTKTRVISRMALASRPIPAATDTQSPAVEGQPTVGPYQVLETLESNAAGQWLLGYDMRLLRKVLIHQVTPGTPPLEASLRNLSRVTRLRWISGRRSSTENWDAFEGIRGKPLFSLAGEKQPWSQVRFWLYDLARELSAAERDGTMPPVLALDRVWITGEGQAKLLDFPAPGLNANEVPSANSATVLESSSRTDHIKRFLGHVAAVALEGRPEAAEEPVEKIKIHLPLHARDFLKKLPGIDSAEAIAGAIKPLLHRLTIVSRPRRAAAVVGCVAFPVLFLLLASVGFTFLDRWKRSNPGVWEISSLLQQRGMQSWFMKEQERKDFDRHLAILISGRYRSVLDDKASWNGAFTTAMIKDEGRQFAEQSLVDYPAPTEAEIAEAEAALKRFIPPPEAYKPSPAVMFFSMMIGYVFLPAAIAALLFRGGLVLRIANVTFVRRDGIPASRLRIFWRLLAAWVPCLILLFMVGPLQIAQPPIFTAAIIAELYALLGLLAILSVLLPTRSLPDYLAGTWPVPR